MSNAFYEMYRNSRNLLDRHEREKESDDPPELNDIVKGWREVIDVVESSHPQIKEWYERNKAMQKSFTPEQIDFICYEIGDWYIEWQDKMWVDGKPNQHWLGTAKEQLKTMICGD